MELNRIDIIKKINTIDKSNGHEELIELLCEILDNKDFASKNKDLVSVIIEIGQLYGYEKYIEMYNEETEEINTFSAYLRKKSYKGLVQDNIHYNYGQLSLLDEIDNNDKVFISAPTSFGKTSMILEYIIRNSNIYNNIIFVLPTNALIEEIYIKIMTINKKHQLNYAVKNTPIMAGDRNILILTPEKYLLFCENNTKRIDLIIMDEAYKILNETNNRNGIDALNNRSFKFRRCIDMISASHSKAIFLSPYTYKLSESMREFLKKHSIKSIDRKIEYVNHQIYDISNTTKAREIFNDFNIKYSTKSKIKNALQVLNKMNNNTIIYIATISEINVVLSSIGPVDNSDLFNDQRFKKFYNHLLDNYCIEEVERWYLINALEKKVGIYISPIPRYIKKEILSLFNGGLLDVLIVTTSFIEGVNSQAKNIIITNQSAANKSLTDLDLLNIAGRSGRFGVYSKGNVYAMKNEIAETIKSAKKNGVCLENPNYVYNGSNGIRSDYELEMIDNKHLNDFEKQRKQMIYEEQNMLKLSDEDLKVSLNVSNYDKIRLYKYFTSLKKEDIDYRKLLIKELFNDTTTTLTVVMKCIFDDIRNAGICIYTDFGEIQPYNSKGEFIWGKFYSIHACRDIKTILLNKKRYLINQYNEILNDTKYYINNYSDIKENFRRAKKLWLYDFFIPNGNFNDFKLYNDTFKFISNVIEYKIPYFMGFYVSIFKLYCEKNTISIDDIAKLDSISISNFFEGGDLENEYSDMYEFGIPRNTILKYKESKTNQPSNNLDAYELLLINEYNEIFN
jgi:superfamily II DNA/RNA helicase